MSEIYDFLTFDQFVTHWSKERPDHEALREEDRSLSYGELEERTAKVVAMLFDLGLKKGDRIAWVGKNSDLYFTLFYGAARAGIVIVPVGWRLAPDEWKYIINDTEAKLVFTGEGFDDVAGKIKDGVPNVTHFITSREARQRLEETPRRDFVASDPEDAVLQLYTSGTTGNPKGAVLTNHNLLALRKQVQAANLDYAEMNEGELILLSMPCAHIGGTGPGIMALTKGLPALVHAEFTPDGFFDAVESGITRLFLVPAALQILLHHPRCREVDFSKLEYILYGASPMPLELLRQCMDMFGAQFIQVYGLTETTGGIAMLAPADHDPNGNERMRSAGQPLPGVEIQVFDKEGNSLPTGEVGEIVTRSTNNMAGYWKLEDATKKAFDGDGWFFTGDAGYLDKDGYLFIHDRVKDMIISGGENVYPAEVESAIYGHPDVMEVAVIGVPDQKWGETVKAVCAPKAGCTIDPDSVIGWARERIAPFKVPTSVDIVEALPRNATGKVLRKDLRAPYWDGFDRQVN